MTALQQQQQQQQLLEELVEWVLGTKPGMKTIGFSFRSDLPKLQTLRNAGASGGVEEVCQEGVPGGCAREELPGGCARGGVPHGW